jgi:hypothetical protein
MDGVYDHNGQYNQAHTDFLIGNDYVLKTAQAHPTYSWRASLSIRNGGMPSTKCIVAPTREQSW